MHTITHYSTVETSLPYSQHKTDFSQLEAILKDNNYIALDKLIIYKQIQFGEPLTAFYEKFKYDNVFYANQTTHLLEILILNYDLELMLNKI